MSELVLRLAVETDYEFYAYTGCLSTARRCALDLIAGVSQIYEQEINVRIVVSTLGLHTTSDDPWDPGDDRYARLSAFRAAFHGPNYPPDSDLAHFLSGVSLGGGVAYRAKLCSKEYGFAVSALQGKIHVPFLSQTFSPPWNYFVVAHEIGHNFGAVHTHDLCPPVDQCKSAPFGSCQTRRVCITNGTIMSYCHSCPGGMANIDLVFHPRIREILRSGADNSCLQLSCPSLIAGVVFLDTDMDGVRDPLEPVLPGYDVFATDSQGHVHVSSTNAQGQFLFPGLSCGDYKLRAQPLLANPFPFQFAGSAQVTLWDCASLLVDIPVRNLLAISALDWVAVF